MSAVVFDACFVVMGVAPMTLLPGAAGAAVDAAAAVAVFVVVLVVVLFVAFLLDEAFVLPSPVSSPVSSPVALLYISPIPGKVNASLILDVPPIKFCNFVFADIF